MIKNKIELKKLLSFLFLNRLAPDCGIPLFTEPKSIPKIIHQTYYSKKLPDEIAQAVSTIKKRNPDWEYRFYDDDDIVRFIQEEYGNSMMAIYNRISNNYGAARADFFRYLLMYRFGGVYLDIKSTAQKPLDEIIHEEDRLILCHWGNSERFHGAGQHDELRGIIDGGEFQQWHIICTPGHPYLRAVINAVVRNIKIYIPEMHETGAYGVLRLTGPVAYSLAIAPLMSMNAHRLESSHEDISLEYSIYSSNKQHYKRLRRHYSELNDPIAKVTLINRFLQAFYIIRKLVFKRLTSPS